MSGPVCPGTVSTVSTVTVQTPVRPDGVGELILTLQAAGRPRLVTTPGTQLGWVMMGW